MFLEQAHWIWLGEISALVYLNHGAGLQSSGAGLRFSCFRHAKEDSFTLWLKSQGKLWNLISNEVKMAHPAVPWQRSHSENGQVLRSLGFREKLEKPRRRLLLLGYLGILQVSKAHI